MKKEHPETVLRRVVKNGMSGAWEMTWHEDRQVSPGTPDISYVMFDNCETGWLELKALDGLERQPWTFKLEPSQPSWIERHAGRIPINLLVAVGTHCWLLDGRSWVILQRPIREEQLTHASLVQFEFPDMRRVLTPELIRLTHRRR
jgi:hypothetical protein